MKKSNSFGFIFLLVCLLTCTTKSDKNVENSGSNSTWSMYTETVPIGFTLSFKYPNDLVLADVIDNCRCVGNAIKNYDTNQGTDSTNTAQWCICMQGNEDYPVAELIHSWPEARLVEEKKDSIIIDNEKALRVIFNSNEKDGPYRQLIYFEKYSTIFEIMNIKKSSNKDFEIFYKSLSIKETM